MKLLITFGCSWTFGVGVGYTNGMTETEYNAIAWDSDLALKESFRGLLCQQHGMDNLNFSKGGCSNQEQFRIAEDFFSSLKFQEYQKRYKDITVLWGITSVLRDEAYFSDACCRKSFFYTDNSMLSKVVMANHYDQSNEVDLLSKKIRFWDNFFDLCGIKNVWFDAFNHHDYNGSIPDHVRNLYAQTSGTEWPTWEEFCQADFTKVRQEIKDEIFSSELRFYNEFYDPTCRMVTANTGPRDLMSQLATQNGMVGLDAAYHNSAWVSDSNRVNFLTNCELLNPYTYHPTAEAHKQIAGMLSKYI